MASSGSAANLVREAHIAFADMRYRDAAFLYEQAGRDFTDTGETPEAFHAGTYAAYSWGMAANFEKMLEKLISLLANTPPYVAPGDVYRCRQLQLDYYISVAKSPLHVIRQSQEAMHSLYLALAPSGPDIAYFRGSIEYEKGHYADSYSSFGIAWSNSGPVWDGLSFGDWYFASKCAISACRLQRLDEAKGWVEKILDDPTGTEPQRRFRRIDCELTLAVLQRDEARMATLLDDLDIVGYRTQSAWRRTTISHLAVTVYTLDSSMGDPLSRGHPANQRLADVADEDTQPLGIREPRSLMVLTQQMAGLRYAAGFIPEEDYFDRPALMMRTPGGCRIPEQVLPRLHAARLAWESAAEIGFQIDKNFGSDRRQRHLANLRNRIEQIAAAC